MKKTLLIFFFSLFFINQSTFSMQESETPKPAQKKQLTSWDKTKMYTAIGGSLIFAWATLFNKSARTKKQTDFSEFSLYHGPTLLALFPTALIAGFIERYQKYELSNNTLYNIVAAYTSLATLGLGYYAYKKMTQSKNEKETQ